MVRESSIYKMGFQVPERLSDFAKESVVAIIDGSRVCVVCTRKHPTGGSEACSITDNACLCEVSYCKAAIIAAGMAEEADEEAVKLMPCALRKKQLVFGGGPRLDTPPSLRSPSRSTMMLFSP